MKTFDRSGEVYLAQSMKDSSRPVESHLSPALRGLVSRSVALLGQVIKRELGERIFETTERIRQDMAQLRQADREVAFNQLQKTYEELKDLDRDGRRGLATAYTLMLELMNACENAYRSHRLGARHRIVVNEGEQPSAIIYVLTAHPTEARAPQNIAIFHQIQTALTRILNELPTENAFTMSDAREREILHLLEIAWRAPIVRERSPKVKDEAEHIYSTALREDVIYELLEMGDSGVPFYLRSWVGGDKDGHPGVDEKVMLESLTLSRRKILNLCLHQVREIRETLALMSSSTLQKKAQTKLTMVDKELRTLKRLLPSDAKKLERARRAVTGLEEQYVASFGAVHPALTRLKQLFHVFPGLVVPLELRESSDVLHSDDKGKLAIDRMLAAIAKLAKGSDPRWYARGFIISMTRAIEDIQAAASKQKRAFGELKLPIVPLFEEAGSLARSETIVDEMLQVPEIRKAASERWGGLVELMVGYSDSSKEAGVLASRLAIAKTLPKLEKTCKRAMLTPIFFHGSGGSVDRGGGSIEDQTAWWPRSALRRYKVTVQGEMVERSLASPEIARRQIENIVGSAVKGLTKPVAFSESPALESFAAKISKAYRTQVGSVAFLELVEKATPYTYLSHLKIGSRPVKRAAQLAAQLGVSGLRAIPWILCWTQTRVLFPTWWGVGQAWTEMSLDEKKEIRQALLDEPVFASYVKALGFTLAKVELPIWRLYLETAPGLKPERKKEAYVEFASEYDRALAFFKYVTGHEDLLWFRPWLGESIRLRSPMIHPLNLLQILSERDNDVHLLRVSVTGVSSGMMTTG